MKTVFTILFVINSCFLFSQTTTNTTQDSLKEEIYFIVEEMPEYPGGIKAFSEYFKSNLKYPNSANEKGIQGTSFFKFVITKDGNIDNVTVLKGMPNCPECDEEAIRVIKSLPKFKPGKQNGKPVNVWWNLPIRYTINPPIILQY